MSLLARAALGYRNYQTHRRILATGLESRKIKFEGIVFHMYASERGRMPLFMLHGFLDSAKTFRRLFPELIRLFDVYAIDLPGFGNTKMPEVRELWRIDSIARSTGRFMLHILAQREPQWKSKPQIFSHSMGGLIAMHAMDYFEKQKIPNPFTRLHMVAPGALRFALKEREAHRKRFYPKTVEETRELLTHLFHETRIDLPDFLLRGLLESWSHKGYEYLAENTIEEEETVFYAPGKRVRFKPGIWLYWGANDRIVPIDYGNVVKKTLQCKLVVVKNSGHCPQVENVPELLGSFIANAGQI